MLAEWNVLSDNLQIVLSREALYRATEIVADIADMLAEEIRAGTLTDQGGPEALSLLANMVRLQGGERLGVCGTA